MKSGIELFDFHPAVHRLLALRRARDYFQREVRRLNEGGIPLMPNLTAGLLEQVANDVNRQMAELATRIWLDGEPTILLVENF